MNDAPVKILNQKVYPAVEHCIYCGATDRLETEHILPFGLSGTASLPKSSCRECATITGSFEQTVLRGPFWPIRVYRELKSRTKHRNSPSTLPISLVRNGTEQTVELKINEYPMLLHFPLFVPPAYLSQTPDYKAGITMTEVASVLFGPRPEDVAKALGATQLKLSANYQPVAFARMIAKIAYAFAVAEGAAGDLEGESFVLPAILGKTDEIGRWVGTLTKPYETHREFLHRIEFHYEKERKLLFGEVQLFSDSQTPSYGVVLGKLKTGASR